MQRCLQLARLGAGNVAPNPMVGAVLVHKDRVIGEGYHHQYGQAHAEVNCINSVVENDKVLLAESTMYVSLEPCAHHGKTPPCADLIVEKRIPDVVVGCKDEFAAVNGKGIEILKSNGVNVTVGILEKEAIELNKRFFIFHKKERPYIILKWAQSNDGKIAGITNERTFISNDITNKLVHKWRSEEAAILIGTNTAAKDNPSLTTRLWTGKHPVRLVIDTDLKLSQTLHLFDGGMRTVVFNAIKEEENGTVSFYKIDKENALQQILHKLYELQIQSMIVEGGAKLLRSFIDQGVWDEARVITNTTLEIAHGIDAPVLKNAVLLTKEQLLNDSIGYYTHGG